MRLVSQNKLHDICYESSNLHIAPHPRNDRRVIIYCCASDADNELDVTAIAEYGDILVAKEVLKMIQVAYSACADRFQKVIFYLPDNDAAADLFYKAIEDPWRYGCWAWNE